MKENKRSKKIVICVSLIIILSILFVIAIIRHKSQTNTEILADLESGKTGSNVVGVYTEWGKAVGGSSSDQITCITETFDGGYVVGGYFESDTIDLGNGVVLNNNGGRDGMLIKYSL